MPSIIQLGRETEPIEGTREECLLQLRYMVRQEDRKCRLRYGAAFIHRISETNYQITVGPHPKSALWTSLVLFE